MQPTLIITRPLPDGVIFAAAFEGINVLLSPLQRIDEVDADCAAKGFIFTSNNGVVQAGRLGLISGFAWCVGDRTAQAARTSGFDAISAHGDVEDLLKLILADSPIFPLAHIRGRNTRGDLAPRLRAAGINCVDCIAYVQTPIPMTSEALQIIEGVGSVVIPLFSLRSATLLRDQVSFGPNITFIAISPTVASVLSGHKVIVAERPDGLAMVAATKRVVATL